MPPQRRPLVHHSPRPQWIARPRRLHLNYLRSKPRQKRRRERSRNQLSQLQHFHAGERPQALVRFVTHGRTRIVSESTARTAANVSAALFAARSTSTYSSKHTRSPCANF